MSRIIAILTGTRAEYGLLKPLMRNIINDPELELFLITTGMHYDPDFGKTINLIKNEGFLPAVEIIEYPIKDNYNDYARYFGNLTSKLVKRISNIKIDMGLVIGDRVEVFAFASTCALLQIPLSHLHGGEKSGNIDGILRHAISKLAQLHFPATKLSADRLIKMGENSSRVHNVGSIGYHFAKLIYDKDTDPILKKFQIKKPYILVVQHPEEDPNKAEMQITTTLEAIDDVDLELSVVIIDPNSDPGGRVIQKAIKNQAINKKNYKRFNSLQQEDYLLILKDAELLLGNSSSGIIEAHAMKTPVINLGQRQKNRERSGNVVDLPFNKSKISNEITKIILNQKYQKSLIISDSPYFKENPVLNIIQIIKSVNLNDDFFYKSLSY